MLEGNKLGVDGGGVNVVNMVNMKPRDSKDRPPIGIKPDETTYDEIERMCAAFDRKRAYIALKLMLRGLAAYKRDGQLKEPGDGGYIDVPLIPALRGRASKKRSSG